jgi:hypothetical protein
VTIEVKSGAVTIVFTANDGTQGSGELIEGNIITFEPETVVFTAPATNQTVVVVLFEGAELLVAPGETVKAVEIDIKPGSYPNGINLGSDGVIPVAILSTPTFDASTVDPSTVALAGAAVNIAGKSDKYQASLEDFDGDGDLDLMLKIVNELDLQEGDAIAGLEGQTYDGMKVQGQDSVRVVP